MLLVVLSCATAHCICPLIVTVYSRQLGVLGHMYIGAGLPAVLRALLCLIECTSTSFRSVSLSLRVTANSAAAHVLLNTLIDMSYASICMMALVIHMIMWTNRFAWHNFRIPRFGVCNLISGFGYHLIQPLEARIRGIHYMHNTLWFRERRVWFRGA